MQQRVIHVGIGTFGKRWCREFLKQNVDDGTIEVVGLVDVDPASLEYGRAQLGLPESACFTDANEAFAKVPADFCTVVVPPNFHEAVIDAAIAHGLDVLCEKPIADTMEGAVRVAQKIAQAGRKMAVTMSHRFDQDKTTLRRVVRSGKLGRVATISCRYQADMRQHMAWGALFRHTMQHPLLIEGAIHHLDIVADLAGAKCDTLFASTWRLDWAEYQGDTDATVSMVFENGVRALYEGSSSTAVGLNDWYQEYVRVDCEFGTAILNHREVEVFTRQDIPRQKQREGQGQKVPLLVQPKWINIWLIEQFCRWLEGGPAMETQVANNVQASALVFGSIESSRTNSPVKVQDYVASFG
ncbi:MAG TPA: Gfo/Idh/MocA family oxidoreductase [Acetobacteraceae bacterium]|nr:Gfo/Idh/MocA family oxidoreductase [Acetobacteraceae bacterium]